MARNSPVVRAFTSCQCGLGVFLTSCYKSVEIVVDSDLASQSPVLHLSDEQRQQIHTDTCVNVLGNSSELKNEIYIQS